MAELGLKKKEVDAIDFAFDVYDFKGDGKVDAFYAGDLIRACNLNPTLRTIEEVGGQSEKENGSTVAVSIAAGSADPSQKPYSSWSIFTWRCLVLARAIQARIRIVLMVLRQLYTECAQLLL